MSALALSGARLAAGGDFTTIGTLTVQGIALFAVPVAPVAVDDAYSHTGFATPLVVAAAGVLGNDSDADADALAAIKVGDPANGVLTLNADGSFSYQPDQDFVGTDSFTYKANDATLDSNVATVTITSWPTATASRRRSPVRRAPMC